MQDLFDAHGRRKRPTEAAQAAFSQDSLDVSETPSSFAANITFPLQQIFQLVKNKKEAMVLLEVGRIGSLLDLETSRLVVDLQHRELLQNSASALALARDPNANSLLPMLTETGRVNAKRLDLIWSNIHALMAKLAEFRTNLRSFQELNAAVAQEFYAAGHVALAQQKLLLARGEKLLISKLEAVIDGSDPFGVSTDSWNILFPDLAAPSPTLVRASPIQTNQSVSSLSALSNTTSQLNMSAKSSRNPTPAAAESRDAVPRQNDAKADGRAEANEIEPPEPKRRKVEFAEPVVQPPAPAAASANQTSPSSHKGPLRPALSTKKQELRLQDDDMDLDIDVPDATDDSHLVALPSQDLRTTHRARQQHRAYYDESNLSQVHLSAPVRLSGEDDEEDDDSPILTKTKPKPLPTLFGHSRAQYAPEPDGGAAASRSNSLGLVDYPLDAPSDEQ